MVVKEKYGNYARCGEWLEPVWFIEEERKFNVGYPVKTGRKRRACSHLECPRCMKKQIVDDSYDTKWKG